MPRRGVEWHLSASRMPRCSSRHDPSTQASGADFTDVFRELVRVPLVQPEAGTAAGSGANTAVRI